MTSTAVISPSSSSDVRVRIVAQRRRTTMDLGTFSSRSSCGGSRQGEKKQEDEARVVIFEMKGALGK